MINLLVSAAVALVLVLFGTPLAIRFLRARGVGQEIREELPETHQVKRGKPTMGGLVIVGGALIGYLVAHAPGGEAFEGEGLLAMAAIVLLGFLGFLDDFIKVRHRRSLGLNKRAKFFGQVVIGLGAAVLLVQVLDHPTRLSFVAPSRVNLQILFYVFALLLISFFSNGVNFADGLDGLAAGSSALVYGSYVIVAFWKFTHPEIYPNEGALDVAIVAAGMMGACAGFLWWNAAPASIVMGDTGALALGGGLGVLALLTDTQLLLVVLGGLYVAETLSVMLQIFTFRVLGGRRIFLMAPFHHHFEMLGWPESTIIVRFWIVSGLFVALGLGLFYADFLTRGGVP